MIRLLSLSVVCVDAIQYNAIPKPDPELKRQKVHFGADRLVRLSTLPLSKPCSFVRILTVGTGWGSNPRLAVRLCEQTLW